MMYLETRNYNYDDSTEVRLTNHRPVMDPDDYTGKYYLTVDGIGKGGNYATLEDWVREMDIEPEDVPAFISRLTSGEWVDITYYI